MNLSQNVLRGPHNPDRRKRGLPVLPKPIGAQAGRLGRSLARYLKPAGVRAHIPWRLAARKTLAHFHRHAANYWRNGQLQEASQHRETLRAYVAEIRRLKTQGFLPTDTEGT